MIVRESAMPNPRRVTFYLSSVDVGPSEEIHTFEANIEISGENATIVLRAKYLETSPSSHAFTVVDWRTGTSKTVSCLEFLNSDSE